MKIIMAALISLAGSLAFSPSVTASEVCGPLDSGKIDTTGDPSSVMVTAPEGFLISSYCV